MIEALLRSARAGQRRAVLFGMASAAVAALSAIGLLAVSGWFLTGAAIAGMTGAASVVAFNYLIPSAAIRGLAILRTLSRYGERLFSHRAMLFALAEVRAALFARLIAAPPTTALLHNRGDVAARLGGDVETLEEALLRTTLVPSGLATLAGTMLLMALAGWAAATALLVAAAASFAVSRRIGRNRVAPALDAESAAFGELKRCYVELAAGGDDIAVYGLATDVQGMIAAAEAPLHHARFAMADADTIISIVHWGLTGVAVAAIIALSPASAPIVALAALAATAAMEIVGSLARLDMQRLKSRGARARLDAMFPDDAALGGDGERAQPVVELEIGDAAHRIAPGDRVVLIGRSGSGKTRLLETLAGLRDDAPEDVRIDGRPPTALPLASRRRLFALAAQDAAMIAGSVADNLALARSGITRDEMHDALAVACLDDVVVQLPGGLDCWLGDDGTHLSAGQRKRLSLARALLAGRPFLLLDEPSEGLDGETEARLISRLTDWFAKEGSGLILVSHRPAMRALAARQIAIGA